MAVVPAGVQPLLSLLPQLRRALGPLKGALDERDGWEVLAAADEKQQMASGVAPASAASGRSMGMGGRRGAKKGKGRGDLAYGPNMNRPPSRVPRGITNQIVWCKQKYNAGIITLSTTLLTESNYSYSLNSLNEYANWSALFDQYCIVQVDAAFEFNCPPGGTAAFVQVYTALDFDNVTNLGTIAGIENYSTCKVVNVKPGTVVRRSVRPCVAGYAGSTATSTVERRWIDAAFQAIPHYGIRFIAGVAGAALTVNPIMTFYIAWRSLI